MRSPRIAALDRRWYPELGDNWDDALFRERILRRLTPASRVLDLGAGAGIVGEMNFRGRAGRVCGVDPDPRVRENPFLDEAKVGSAEAIPYGDGSFDLVFADNVLEHLPDPPRVFAEVHRVLVPGGRFLAKTPNKWHYVPLLARCTPLAFHRAYNRARGRAEEDTFPTLYRANTCRAVSRLAAASGFDVDGIALLEGRPEYLRVSVPTYAVGFLYERLVNASAALAWLRVLLVIELIRRRPGP